MTSPRYKLALQAGCPDNYSTYSKVLGYAYTLGGAYVAQFALNRIHGCNAPDSDAWVNIIDTSPDNYGTVYIQKPVQCWPHSSYFIPVACDCPF